MDNFSTLAKSKILKAFAAAPYPGDKDLVSAPAERDPESLEIAQAFRGKRWNGISSETLHEFAQALPLFTPRAFRYYLPAYMLETLNSEDPEDVLKDFVPFNLTPPGDQEKTEDVFFAERAGLLSPAERDAIASFLERIMQLRITEWRGAQMQPEIDKLQRAVDFWSKGTRK
jgi:hypothetical protein